MMINPYLANFTMFLGLSWYAFKMTLCITFNTYTISRDLILVLDRYARSSLQTDLGEILGIGELIKPKNWFHQSQVIRKEFVKLLGQDLRGKIIRNRSL